MSLEYPLRDPNEGIIQCPNCEATMMEGDGCSMCEHNEQEDCECQFCTACLRELRRYLMGSTAKE